MRRGRGKDGRVNLALRLGLEIGALAGLGSAVWTLRPVPPRWQ